MDTERLRTLLAAGEQLDVEFKRGGARELNDRDLVEAVVCLANGPGGFLLVGVEDDGTVSGAAPRHGTRTDPDRLRALIVNRTVSPVSVDVDVVTLDSYEVIAIRVPAAASPVGTSDGVYKRRALGHDGKPQCIPYAPHEMFAAHFSAAGMDYAEVIARGATFDDLDPLEFERLRSLASHPPADRALAELSDGEIARALGATRDDSDGQTRVTLGGVLMFGTGPALARHVPNAEVAFQVIAGSRVSTNEVYRLPLFRAADLLTDRVRAHNTEEELMWGMLRIGLERVPTVAARESIANALIHRDYAEPGAVRVALGEDEFTVSSPGGFPPGVTLDNVLEVTRPRSRTLADAFKRAGLVERSGRGVGLMFDAQLRTGRGGPDFSRSSERLVLVGLPSSRADIELARFIVASEQSTQHKFTLSELRLVHALRAGGPRSLQELTDELNLAPGQARGVLTRLQERGLVEGRGSGRGRRFHLSSVFYRFAEDTSAYVRIRAAEPIQQAQMIVRYVTEFGSITRAQAAELCLISAQAASLLLRRMTTDGELVMEGERRGARYVLPKDT